MQNPHVQRTIASIQAELQGVVFGVGAFPFLPLSVEGQAHRLVTEAISHEDLEKMYIWYIWSVLIHMEPAMDGKRRLCCTGALDKRCVLMLVPTRRSTKTIHAKSLL